MMLRLVKIVEPCERGLISSVFRRLSTGLMRHFSTDLHLADGSSAEIALKTADPNELVRRFGCEATLRFYEEDVMPALRKLSPDGKVWRLRYEVAFHLAQLRARQEPPRGVIDVIEEMIEEIPAARFEEVESEQGNASAEQLRLVERENARERLRIRSHLASLLEEAAHRMLNHGYEDEALRAFRLLEHLGSLTSNHRQKYAELLWRRGDRSRSALKVYLEYMGDCGWKPHLPGMAQFVSDEMSIDERMPGQKISERLPLNQLALCGRNPPPLVLRHAGLAYLRLKEPGRALGYLRKAEALDGADGGLTHFYLGQALFGLKEFGQAAEAFEKAAGKNFSLSRIASWQGRAYAETKQWEKALSTFRKAERELGEVIDSEFYLQWGRASFLMKEWADSEHRFRTAIRQDGANWRAAYGLAICLEKQGRRSEAIELLRATTARFSECAPALHFLGRLLESEGGTSEAVSFFRHAHALSPSDIEYQLSLGLALFDLGDAEAAPILERVARAGEGGPEILRRVVIGLLRAGDRLRARYWLRKLAAEGSATEAVILFDGRDRISEATEAFNARRYREAADLFERAGEHFGHDGRIRERMALALARDAAGRVAAGETEGVWDQIERAYALSSDAEVRFLFGFSQLVRGNPREARDHFSVLAREHPDRDQYQFFNCLSAYFCGEERSLDMLDRVGPVAGATNINSLLAFLQAQLAAARGAFEEASEKVRAWAEDQDAVRGLGLPARQINTFTALCLLRGVKRKRQQIVRFLESLNERYGDGYWDLALAIARHHIAAEQHSELEKLEECAAAYRRLLEAAEEEDCRAIAVHYCRLLRALACRMARAGRIGDALDALKRMDDLPVETAQEVLSLREMLIERLREPSQEKAYALIDSDPDGARAVWEEMLDRNPDDFVSLQHLACLAWSRAFDEVAAERTEESVPFWREGLERYRQLFENQRYWDHLREKGRILGQRPGYPFKEEAFEMWRESALYEMAHTLIELISVVMSGYDAAEEKEKERKVRTARVLMNVIRESNLPD
ncbi:MAG TPA: tetratricopeptide repeat protein [Blastocatellia bacterium]|nr:tetratricopeptide repeat protein [Blastocatellia bacterium]